MITILPEQKVRKQSLFTSYSAKTCNRTCYKREKLSESFIRQPCTIRSKFAVNSTLWIPKNCLQDYIYF